MERPNKPNNSTKVMLGLIERGRQYIFEEKYGEWGKFITRAYNADKQLAEEAIIPALEIMELLSLGVDYDTVDDVLWYNLHGDDHASLQVPYILMRFCKDGPEFLEAKRHNFYKDNLVSMVLIETDNDSLRRKEGNKPETMTEQQKTERIEELIRKYGERKCQIQLRKNSQSVRDLLNKRRDIAAKMAKYHEDER